METLPNRFLIVIGLASVFLQVTNALKQITNHSIHEQEHEDINHMVDRLISMILTNVLKGVCHLDNQTIVTSRATLDNCIDYLTYSGINPTVAFDVTHSAEMLILSSILSVFSDIDNVNVVVSDYQLFNRHDLVITITIPGKRETRYLPHRVPGKYF